MEIKRKSDWGMDEMSGEAKIEGFAEILGVGVCSPIRKDLSEVESLFRSGKWTLTRKQADAGKRPVVCRVVCRRLAPLEAELHT
ncbi:hypothetical protein N7539_007520 [Penicillium diatomitis]|uniref:Uncharacterized protein n=1 Tax=Penicillium diatomitis TaxID=2819901 RepID=A0A9W9WW63_9EURO|nr:uncharacterized protein N7539_007520 [Penicillium diatomitis]KAJ5477376.1 hypothetical protein N7539_007520 [Penicillium diatomitis]